MAAQLQRPALEGGLYKKGIGIYATSYSLWHGRMLGTILIMALGLAPLPAKAQNAAQDVAPNFDAATSQLIKDGQAAMESKHYQEAEMLFKNANRATNYSCLPCSLGLAETLVHLGDPKEALDNAEIAVALATNDQEKATAYTLCGFLFGVQGTSESNREKAESEYREALELDPTRAPAHLGLAIILFRKSQDAAGKEEASRYLELAPDGPSASYARSLIENPRRASESFAPDFSFKTLQGRTVSLSDFKGKFLVLDFWATWCPPCRDSVDELKDLTKRYPGDRVVLISVSADQDERAWSDFVEKKNMTWLQYLDRDERIVELFQVRAYPTYLVIDPEGMIRRRLVGRNPQESVVHRLKNTLDGLTAKKR